MSPGEVICDYKGKYTSLKVLPFEDASREVSLEGTLVSEYQGRLSGTEVGTVYWRQASDGTATLEGAGDFSEAVGPFYA